MTNFAKKYGKNLVSTVKSTKKAKQRLAKSGKLRDAAKVFENLID